jgi:hypothetical protein
MAVAFTPVWASLTSGIGAGVAAGIVFGVIAGLARATYGRNCVRIVAAEQGLVVEGSAAPTVIPWDAVIAVEIRVHAFVSASFAVHARVANGTAQFRALGQENATEQAAFLRICAREVRRAGAPIRVGPVASLMDAGVRRDLLRPMLVDVILSSLALVALRGGWAAPVAFVGPLVRTSLEAMLRFPLAPTSYEPSAAGWERVRAEERASVRALPASLRAWWTALHGGAA